MEKSSSKLRVLAICQYFPPDMGGSATRAYNVAKGLMLNNCKVVVIAAFPHYPIGKIPKEYRWKALKIEFVDGIKVIRTFVPPLPSEGLVRRAIMFASFSISSLFALPLVKNFDVIWAANPNLLSMFPAMIYGVLKRRPIALNVDDLWPEFLYTPSIKENSLIMKIAGFIAKLAYLKANLITPISHGYVNVICEKYGVSQEKVHVIRAGVDLNKFGVANSYLVSDENTFTVLYIGAFSVAYDFDQVLLAAKTLENVNGIEFVLQGEGELTNYVKTRAKELRLKNLNVNDKIVSREEVAKLLSSADALILPLRDLGMPYLGISSKLYEYQAAAKPILCCSSGQPGRYVSETNSGIVIKPGDYKALAKSILYLRENYKVAEKLGVSGRQYVENNLSIEKIGLQMKRVFQFNVYSQKSLLGLKDEIDVYDKARVTVGTGEIEEFDKIIFSNVIRRREIDLISSELQAVKPERILDLGCGGGWLSKVLVSNKCEVVGIDINRSLVMSARRTAPTGDFIVGDCMNLPFRDKSFDAIAGIAILHHLNTYRALSECYRIATEGSLLLFMEPNKLNPVSALGRKMFPLETHTKREKPLSSYELIESITKASLVIKEIRHVFPFSFGLARLFRRSRFPEILVPIISISEMLLEKLPLIKHLSSTFFVVAIRN